MFRDMTGRSDGRGDHGSGPGYADVRSFALQGSSRELRVIAGFDAVVPETLKEREVMGIGDRSLPVGGVGRERLPGVPRRRPQGLVRLSADAGRVRGLPGDVPHGDNALVVTLPWSSLGKMRKGFVAAFADYSNASKSPATSTEDFLPEKGRLRFAR